MTLRSLLLFVHVNLYLRMEHRRRKLSIVCRHELRPFLQGTRVFLIFLAVFWLWFTIILAPFTADKCVFRWLVRWSFWWIQDLVRLIRRWWFVRFFFILVGLAAESALPHPSVLLIEQLLIQSFHTAIGSFLRVWNILELCEVSLCAASDNR